MSKLDDLINELCPNGVEYKRLECLCKINNYKQLGASELENLIDNNGTISLLPSSRDDNWKTTIEKSKNYVCEGEVFTMGRARHANAKYVKGQFISSNNVIIESNNTNKLLTKYLYYFVISKEKDMYVETSTYPKFDNTIFNNLQIPVPPLPVQEEIVRILDKFTELTAELTAEFTARKKQYEYYRDELIESSKGEHGKLLNLLVQPITDGPHTTPTFVEKGVPFVSATAVYNGKINLQDAQGLISYKFDAECAKKYKPKRNDIYMVKSGSTTGKVAFVDNDDDFNIWSPLAAMRCSNYITARYLYFILQSNNVQEQVRMKMSHGSQPNLSMRVLEQFNVIIPSLEEQQRIVLILDRFDTLCNDITSGLPAEIEYRTKQYEYYRDRLLTFKRLGD